MKTIHSKFRKRALLMIYSVLALILMIIPGAAIFIWLAVDSFETTPLIALLVFMDLITFITFIRHLQARFNIITIHEKGVHVRRFPGLGSSFDMSFDNITEIKKKNDPSQDNTGKLMVIISKDNQKLRIGNFCYKNYNEIAKSLTGQK